MPNASPWLMTIKYEWIAIKDENIWDMGRGEGYKQYINQATKVIDANGGTVLPDL